MVPCTRGRKTIFYHTVFYLSEGLYGIISTRVNLLWSNLTNPAPPRRHPATLCAKTHRPSLRRSPASLPRKWLIYFDETYWKRLICNWKKTVKLFKGKEHLVSWNMAGKFWEEKNLENHGDFLWLAGLDSPIHPKNRSMLHQPLATLPCRSLAFETWPQHAPNHIYSPKTDSSNAWCSQKKLIHNYSPKRF